MKKNGKIVVFVNLLCKNCKFAFLEKTWIVKTCTECEKLVVKKHVLYQNMFLGHCKNNIVTKL